MPGVPGQPDARESAARRGYDRRWARVSLGFRRANPLCLGCHAAGRVQAAEVTDHIVPHRGDQGLFWDPGNWQASCRWHHDQVKQRLERAYDAGEIDRDALSLDSPRALELAKHLWSLR